MESGMVFGVSEFVAYVNQTMETAYPYVEIQGELSNFRVSKNRWVYFDIKDETASVRCFGTVYSLPGPLEDGMLVRIAGSPRLHPLYNFSFNFLSIAPVGEGAIRRSADLLLAKLEAEGLFDVSRKRLLPYAPMHIALITAGESAAYADFMKISSARWGGMRIDHYDVLVQGEKSPAQIVRALTRANEAAEVPQAIVLIRGGGSADDLAAFSDERVVRAVAASRIPTVVAIGHEVDVSLAELAADLRASTPSNAAELLLPDKRHLRGTLAEKRRQLDRLLADFIRGRQESTRVRTAQLDDRLSAILSFAKQRTAGHRMLLDAYDPEAPLQRGYALIRKDGQLVYSADDVRTGDALQVRLRDGNINVRVTNANDTKEGA